jgi:RNA polymerase sigma factor (sigma-70 family)
VSNHSTFDASGLWRRAAQGDVAAQNELFKELYVRIQPLAKHWCWRKSHDPDDLVQETLVVLLQKFGEEVENPMAYARKIMWNLLGNILNKKENRTPTISIDAGDEDGEQLGTRGWEPQSEDPSPEEILLRKEKAAILAKAISKFKPPYRDILEEHFVGGSAAEQIERLKTRGIEIKTATFYVYKKRAVDELNGKLSYE